MPSFYSSISEDNFKLPDMGDYYDESLTEELIKNVNEKNPLDAAYYLEDPFTTVLGYNQEYEVFVLKANPVIKRFDENNDATGASFEDLNVIDGDTVPFYIESIQDNSSGFIINNATYADFKDYAYNNSQFSTFKEKVLSLRIIGINAPEVPHYQIAVINKNDSDMDLIKYYSTEDIKRNPQFVIEVNKIRTPGQSYQFIKIGSLWHEIVEEYQNNFPFKYANQYRGLSEQDKGDNLYYKYVTKDDQTDGDLVKNTNPPINTGIQAKQAMLNLLNDMTDIRIIVDALQLYTGTKYSEMYKQIELLQNEDKSIWTLVSSLWRSAFGDDLYKYANFGTFGQDAYKRFLGAIYVKCPNIAGDSWINAGKYIKAKVGTSVELAPGVTPRDVLYGNSISDAFKLYSYDATHTIYADGFYNLSSEDYDDRQEIQKEISGHSLDLLEKYTVMIGDTMLMIPPTSIRVVSQIDSARVPLIRSKGAIVKQKPHTDKNIEMTIYFNGEYGINGVPIKRQTPKQKGTDEYMTYYMNGLRSLIAQFKLTPFLPIENEYINEILGIEAVTLAGIQIQTMPMYPKCLMVTLNLQQFNYRVYLNELPIPDPEKNEHYNKNMFSSCINYNIMRYYYQRALINGEKIKSLSADSQDFIENTMGNKVKLIPMEFKSPKIEFLILDDEWLEKLHQVNELARKNAISQTQPLNSKTIQWADEIGITMKNILSKLNYIESNKIKVGPNYDIDIYQELIDSGLNPHLISVSKSVSDISFYFSIESLTIEELDNLVLIIKKELDLVDTHNDLLKNAILKLSFVVDEKSGLATFDRATDSYKLAQFFANRSSGLEGDSDLGYSDWNKFSTITNEAYYKLLKDNAIDKETFLSAKFISYPTGDLIVQQFSISMSNAISNTKLKIHEGYAAQYMGGQDTILDFVFYTKDESTVSAISAMQEKAIQQLIQYKEIITCWPIRIDSELTKLCGVNEVIIESIDINTVPMQPGLYAVQVRAISVDRTMRNKEALEKLDAQNNAGAMTPSTVGSMVYKTYFDLNKTLAKAEVYPDLELPTLDELEATGYKFLRYMNNKNKRIYPDPDFYFVYSYVYSSQMVRKSIVDYFDKASSNGEDTALIEDIATNFYDDSTSQEVLTKSSKENNVLTYEYSDPNGRAFYQAQLNEQDKKLDSALKQSYSKNINDKTNAERTKSFYDSYNKYESELLAISTPTWNVCKEIKCLLPESMLAIDGDNVLKNTIIDKENEIVKAIDMVLSKPITISPNSVDGINVQYKYYLIERLYKFIDKEMSSGIWSQIMKILAPSNINDNTKKLISSLYEAAAIALSANTEWSGNKDSYDELNNYAKAFISSRYYGMPLDGIPSHGSTNVGYHSARYPYCPIIDSQTGIMFNATSVTQAIREGLSFGPYQIKKYEPTYLQNFYLDKDVAFKKKDFLDPYYNKTLNSGVNQYEYMNGLVNSTDYSIEAFHRIVLVWIKKLISTHSFFSIFDIKRTEIKEKLMDFSSEVSKYIKEQETTEIQGSSKWEGRGDDESNNSSSISSSNVSSSTRWEVMYREGKAPNKNEKYDVSALSTTLGDVGDSLINMVADYDTTLVLGKIFLPIICAVTQGENIIYNKIISADVGSLEAITRSCQIAINSTINIEDGERYFRKYIRALGITTPEILTGISAIASSSQTALEEAYASKYQKLWLQASQDPSLWVLHSYYDMVVNDKRGRMARAFPTYYMMFVDEGRKIGYWKLHDNFYNMSSIVEVEVVKSRKIVADTAKITMTNLYKTFSTDDEDLKKDYIHNVRDVWNSVFSPSVYFNQEENFRTNEMDINNVKLKPGARIHLRMGYSGDASDLPIVFNGVVTEASTGELIELVAQGDAHELSNNQIFAGITADNAADLENESSGLKWIYNFFTEGASPKDMIRNVLTTKSGFFGKLVNKFTNGRFFNDNKFGITHFGEIDYKDIHKDGEVMQNIYEGEGRMPWQGESENPNSVDTILKYSDYSAPVFTIELKDKSAWDIFNICSAASVEFITAITTFGLRSTIFFGRPHYYYAYDYAISDTGTITEKRKPYQQFHIIDSYSDIIANNIRANGTNVKTVAIPIYKGPGWFNKAIEKKGEPLWADWDIYPEYQKTMVVNTGMQWKGNKLGFLGYNYYKNEWSKDGGAKIAWRMAAKALKDSFKDMYDGEVIIIGDSSIKPYDKIFLNDAYENMDGTFEVEATVYSLNSNTGFTTSVFADCISTVDSRYEELGSIWSKQVFMQVTAAKAAFYTFGRIFNTSTRPILNYIARNINKGAYGITDTINKVASMADKEELIKYSKMESWSDKFYSVLNLSSSEVAVWNSLDRFAKWKSALNNINYTEHTSANLINILKTLNNTMGSTDPSFVSKALNDALEKENVKDKDKALIEEVIKTLNGQSEALNKGTYIAIKNGSKEMLDTIIVQVSKQQAKGTLKPNQVDAFEKLVKFTNECGDKITDADNMLKALSYADELSEIVDIKEDVEAFSRIQTCANALKTSMTKTDNVLDTAKVASKITVSAITTAGIISNILWFAVEEALMYVLEKSVYNWIENKMASFNVLTVFPLKKEGSVHVAGIDGHQGLVVGSPTWESKGPIDNFILWAFKDRTGLLGGLQDIFFSEEMKAIADTYKKNNKLGNYADVKEETISGMLRALAESEASSFSYYKALAIAQRILDPNSPSAHYTYKVTRIVCDIDDIPNNDIINNELVIINNNNQSLLKYYYKDLVATIHSASDENYELSDSEKIEKTLAIEFNSQSSLTSKCVVNGLYLSNGRVDLPAMRADAFQIFYKILELTESEMLKVKYGDGKKYKVWLKSGTIINDTTWSATGYIFRISISNMEDSITESILKSIQEDLQSLLLKQSNEAVNIMQWRKIEGNNTYEIFLAPRDEDFINKM